MTKCHTWRIRVASVVVLALAALLPAAVPTALAASSMHLSRTLVAPGDIVTVTGAGFQAGDQVVVSADIRVANSPRRIQAATTADNNGAFNTTLPLPGGTSQGTYQITARDFHGHVAQQNLTVLPLAYLRVGGSIPTVYVIPNHAFYASGSGFQAAETVKLSATFPLYNGNSVAVSKNVQTDKNGEFYEALVRVPRGAKPATLSLIAAGQSSNKQAKATLTVFYRPSIFLGPRAVHPGTDVTVNGRDFVADTAVRVSVAFPRSGATSQTLTRTAGADGNGAFSTSISVPSNALVGTYTVTAVDTVGGFKAYTSVTVLVHPAISIDTKTALPGQTITVTGSNYASGVQVTVSATFALQGGGNRTVTTTAQTGGSGSFSTRLSIPGNAAPGSVTVTAKGPNGQASAQLQVQPRPAPKATATPTLKPTSTPKPTVHASARVVPSVTLPNQTVGLIGTGFPANANVTVSVTVDLRGGGNRRISKNAVTDSSGSFTTALRVPYQAAPGTYTVTASASNVQANGTLQVLPLSAHPKNLNFLWISLWYHTARQGTWDYVIVQSTLKSQLGIWVHVIFPSGQHWDFYTLTDHSGRWAVKFNIPRHSVSPHSNQAYVTFQLWHGKQTTQSFMDFTLV